MDENTGYGRLSATAMAALQLRSQPFDDATADLDWFADQTTLDQLNNIKDAIIDGDELLLLTGVADSGKTVLLKQLSTNSGSRIQCFSVRGSERFSVYNLYAGLLEAFGLRPPVELEDALREVVACLQSMLDRNNIGVIVLDDADRVPREELHKLIDSLLYLNRGDELLLRLLLASKPEFEANIPDLLPPDTNLPYAALVIEPYSATRTAHYIDFRLNQAGHFDAFPLSDRQVHTLCNQASGIPGRINHLAANEINELYATAETRAGASVAAAGATDWLSQKAVRYGLGALAALFILGALWLFMPKDTANPDDFKVVSNEPVAIQAPEREELAAEPTATASADAATDTSPNTATDTSANATANTSASTATDNTATTVSDTQTVAADATAPANQTTGGAVTSATQPTTVVDAPATTATSTADSQSAANPPAASEAATQAATTATPAPSTQPADRAAQAPSAATQSDAAPLESANWILVQNPAAFTVQMSASTDRASVVNFMTRANLEGPNSIYSFRRGGNTWYAAVHGLFDSLDDARVAVAAMSDIAKADKPWIRPVAQIQNNLKNQ